ncbi:hypothetical protein OAI46_06895 [Alphaproteobacteria bacterium]|nr:hypothetical protein [Alphaproteobacteria bacterium]MDC0148570.1 hypothetical protein [Alphaproteobacteria bacterium]
MLLQPLSSLAFSPSDTALSCLTLAARIDGSMDDADALLIADMVATSQSLKSITAPQLAHVQDATMAILGSEDGFETLLEIIEASAAHGEVLYTLSVEFIVRRERISPAEMRLLDILADRLRLAPLTRAAIDTATRIRFTALD